MNIIDQYPLLIPDIPPTDLTLLPGQNNIMLDKALRYAVWDRAWLPFDYFQYWRWN